ncbi:MAG: ADP-glyceromanno-heptose 6-epimerase [Saprospiraceae bacterium]|nr:ADP-glyceromanno-heptose 6-epimerase [Saprospiraceae bacterium]MBK9994830.1 ADP-glyceromanno-heptose 6-epimerase [Saprospiraceae bacterium]
MTEKKNKLQGKSIVITGAAGFIGSCLVEKLNSLGETKLILVDAKEKANHPNLADKKYKNYIDRAFFLNWFEANHKDIKYVFHIGARTDTTEQNESIFNDLNLNYSKAIWNDCASYQIPMIYASSAATYGDGRQGYSDRHEFIPSLVPLNPYGRSKQQFDVWALEQEQAPPLWYGFKFFNVFGPNEYHKGRMASVIFHGFHQINETKKMKLFASNDSKIQDGEQRRDFIYVKELIDVLLHFYDHQFENGIYNLGTGKANTFNELASNIFSALELKKHIEYIPLPVDIAQSYQNFTEANTEKLLANSNYHYKYNFESAVHDYVNQYLKFGKII